MVWVLDETSNTFTVPLKLVGDATISQIKIDGIEVFPTLNAVPSHKTGETFTVQVQLKNVGAASSKLQYVLIDGLSYTEASASAIAINGTWSGTVLSFDMPPSAVSFRIKANHEE